MREEKQKLHCHLFTFLGTDAQSYTYNTVISGHVDKNITNKRQQAAKKASSAPDNVILISVSYLGYMTMEEATGDSE